MNAMVTVIVGVYNGEAFLPELLSSIIDQTCSSWRCLCVDDGSSDGSLQMLRKYERRDGRFKVLVKTNGGVGSARNVALAEVETPFVMFADQDDKLMPNAVQTALDAIRDGDADIVRFNSNRHVKVSPFVWERIYKTEKVKDVKFPCITGGEDTAWLFELTCRGLKERTISDELYFNRPNGGSFSRNVSPRYIQNVFMGFRHMWQSGIDHGMSVWRLRRLLGSHVFWFSLSVILKHFCWANVSTLAENLKRLLGGSDLGPETPAEAKDGILFVDHQAHTITKSADFFVDLLKREYGVILHYYDKIYRTGVRKCRCSDTVIWWEFLNDRRRIYVSGRKNVFVPMYDNEWGSYWQWRRIALSGMGVISFCEKVTRHAKRCGVKNIIEVKYFPNPADYTGMAGNLKQALYWDRGCISERVVRTLFEGMDIGLVRKTTFMPQSEYLEFIRDMGLVVAPRLAEGIGMPVVEAMAMGKCVVAHDDATMNEYIINGESGILFDANDPKPISRAAVERVRKNIGPRAKALHKRWKMDESRILDFVAQQQPCTPSWTNRLRMSLMYPLFVLEGLLYRMRH